MKICYWPDGTWCEHSEIQEMSHMSDDYATFEVSEPDALTLDELYEDVEVFVQKLVRA